LWGRAAFSMMAEIEARLLGMPYRPLRGNSLNSVGITSCRNFIISVGFTVRGPKKLEQVVFQNKQILETLKKLFNE
jgi:hypothetical protein